MMGAFGDVVPQTQQRPQLREGSMHLPGQGFSDSAPLHRRATC
jgi:hypothetical protein